MNNVLKFDPSKKRKPEPEMPKTPTGPAKFIWVSALVGPLGSALMLVTLFGFSQLWAAITNPLSLSGWAEIGKAYGLALVLAIFALPFSLAALAPLAMAVNKGRALLQGEFVRRAIIAGGVYGFCAVIAVNIYAGVNMLGGNIVDTIIGLIAGAVAGLLLSFLWAHVCWLTLSKLRKPVTVH